MRLPSPFINEAHARAISRRWWRAALREFFIWAVCAALAVALGRDAYLGMHPAPWVGECLLVGSLMLFNRAALWAGFLAGASIQAAHAAGIAFSDAWGLWSVRLLEFWLLSLVARGAIRAWLWSRPFLGNGASPAVRSGFGSPFAEPTGRIPPDYNRATDEYVYSDGRRERAFLHVPYPRPGIDDGLDRSNEDYCDLDLH